VLDKCVYKKAMIEYSLLKKIKSSRVLVTYFYNPDGKPFEIEHIWADKMEYHSDEFTQLHEFNEMRNRLGDLILLPKGTNQSFGDGDYEEKLPHYIRENLLAQSLNTACYDRNPNFLNFIKQSGLPFKAHSQYKKQDLDTSQALYKLISDQIWSLDFFKEEIND
jgi:hypothetical protein